MGAEMDEARASGLTVAIAYIETERAAEEYERLVEQAGKDFAAEVDRFSQEG